MAISKGSVISLYNPDYPANPPHVWFVISDKDTEGRILIVNMTSDDGKHDRTCMLVVGDHDEVKHNSIINYPEAMNPELSDLQKAVDTNLAEEKNAMSTELLQKIQDGAKKSPHLPKKFQSYFPLF